MPAFSEKSLEILSTCDQKLVDLCTRVVRTIDCAVTSGYRTAAQQKELLLQGKSKTGPEKSLHCTFPSRAVDLAPCSGGKVTWDPTAAYFLAGYVKRTAEEMGIKIRCGADWNRNFDVTDEDFHDAYHFELEKEQ